MSENNYKNYERLKVLIAEDDDRNIFALTSILEEEDIEIVIVKNGNDALKFLLKDPTFDLILMDIMMPGLDGYETMKEIRKLKRFQNLPIIALTANAMKGDKEKCLNAGATAYLSKPINIEKLFDTIDSTLTEVA